MSPDRDDITTSSSKQVTANEPDPLFWKNAKAMASFG
jgi:hypothetical protein